MLQIELITLAVSMEPTHTPLPGAFQKLFDQGEQGRVV